MAEQKLVALEAINGNTYIGKISDTDPEKLTDYLVVRTDSFVAGGSSFASSLRLEYSRAQEDDERMRKINSKSRDTNFSKEMTFRTEHMITAHDLS